MTVNVSSVIDGEKLLEAINTFNSIAGKPIAAYQMGDQFSDGSIYYSASFFLLGVWSERHLKKKLKNLTLSFA